jgi:hypothetical protein
MLVVLFIAGYSKCFPGVTEPWLLAESPPTCPAGVRGIGTCHPFWKRLFLRRAATRRLDEPSLPRITITRRHPGGSRFRRGAACHPNGFHAYRFAEERYFGRLISP